MRHIRVALYDITSGTYADVLSKAKTGGLLPMFERRAGFQSLGLAEIDPVTFLSVSAWETRAQADDASSAAADWVTSNIGGQVRLRHNFIGDLGLDTDARTLAPAVP